MTGWPEDIDHRITTLDRSDTTGLYLHIFASPIPLNARHSCIRPKFTGGSESADNVETISLLRSRSEESLKPDLRRLTSLKFIDFFLQNKIPYGNCPAAALF